MESGV